MHEEIFCGIKKHSDVSAEKFNGHLFRDTQGFSATGLEPAGTCRVGSCPLQAPGTTL